MYDDTNEVYLTLPSNTNGKENTASCFTTIFNTPLELKGEWEVALADLQIPESLTNIPERVLVMRIWLKPPAAGETSWWTFRISEYLRKYATVEQNQPKHLGISNLTYSDIIDGCNSYTYNSAEQCIDIYETAGSTSKISNIIKWINNTVSVAICNSAFRLLMEDQVTGRIKYCLPAEFFLKIQFNGCSRINQILGLVRIGTLTSSENITATDSLNVNATTTFQYTLAPYNPDIRNGVNSLFVYCDIIDMQPVETTTAPLLRCIRLGDPKLDLLQYKRVIRSKISTLEISIRDLAGRPVKFLRGITVCTLHFRRRRVI